MSRAAVVDFAAPEPEPPPALRRIRWISRGLETLFVVLALCWAAIALPLIADLVAPYAGKHFAVGPAGVIIQNPAVHLPPGYIPPEDMPAAQRLAHVPVGLLNFAPPFLLFWSLRRLFGLYARGVVFAPENARCLKRVGLALIVMAIAPGLGVLFLTSLHFVIDRQWMHGAILEELILGAVVYVIAQVMQVGREIEEERSQFI